MKTRLSKSVADGFAFALEKAEYREELHPRDAHGRWSEKPEEDKKEEARLRAQRKGLQAQRSDLRAAGLSSDVRVLDEDIKRVDQQLAERQARAQQRAAAVAAPPPPKPSVLGAAPLGFVAPVSVPSAPVAPPPPPVRPAPPAPPAPAPAPAPAPVKVAEPRGPAIPPGQYLRRATPAERRHELDAIRRMADDKLDLRLRKITNPQKLKTFAEVLEAEGKRNFAIKAQEKLRKMGWDIRGRPIQAAPAVAPAPAPAPVQQVQAPAPAPAPVQAPPAEPRQPDLRRHVRPAERKQELDRIEGLDDRQILKKIRLFKDMQKLKNFADTLEQVGKHDIAERARARLLRHGYAADGKWVGKGGAQRPPIPQSPAHAPQPRPIAPPQPQMVQPIPVRQGPRPDQKAVYASAEMMQKVATGGAEPQSNPHIDSHKEILGNGTGETHKITLKDGTKVAWKPGNGTSMAKRYHGEPGGENSMRPELDARISESKREMASYQMSEVMGMGIVPHVEFANFKIGSGGDGHIMGWVDGKEANDVSAQLNKDYNDGHIDLHRLAALDFLTCNTDRHPHNWMRGEDGRYYAIDNGLSMPRDSTGRIRSWPLEGLGGQKIPDQVKDEVRKLTDEKLRDIVIGNGFTEDDFVGAKARRDVFLSKRSWPTERGDPWGLSPMGGQKWLTEARTLAGHEKWKMKKN